MQIYKNIRYETKVKELLNFIDFLGIYKKQKTSIPKTIQAYFFTFAV